VNAHPKAEEVAQGKEAGNEVWSDDSLSKALGLSDEEWGARLSKEAWTLQEAAYLDLNLKPEIGLPALNSLTGPLVRLMHDAIGAGTLKAWRDEVTSDLKVRPPDYVKWRSTKTAPAFRGAMPQPFSRLTAPRADTAQANSTAATPKPLYDYRSGHTEQNAKRASYALFGALWLMCRFPSDCRSPSKGVVAANAIAAKLALDETRSMIWPNAVTLPTQGQMTELFRDSLNLDKRPPRIARQHPNHHLVQQEYLFRSVV